MKHQVRRIISAGSFIALIQQTVLTAHAGIYQARCAGGGDCTVSLMNGKISIPGTLISSEDVISWSQGGSGTKTDIGMGVGSVVLFGLPGIIGFGAKKHDYQYYINYIDASGNGQMATIQFKNSVPANQFMMEMMGMTGLSMGEINKSAQSRLKRNQPVGATEATSEPVEFSSGSCAIILKRYKCSWSKYLEANPVVSKWAKSNPVLVPAEKARLGAVD